MCRNEKNPFELGVEGQNFELFKWKSKKRYREIAAQFQIGKTAASSIWKDDKKLRKEFEFFKGNCKTKRARQFSLTNETLYNWYGKCCAAGIYQFGSMLKEEALKIKESLKDSSKDSFTAFWLEKWYSRKAYYWEAHNVWLPTVKSWIERINELVKGCKLEDISNMN